MGVKTPESMSSEEMLSILRECRSVVQLHEETSDMWTERAMTKLRERIEGAMRYIMTETKKPKIAMTYPDPLPVYPNPETGGFE